MQGFIPYLGRSLSHGTGSMQGFLCRESPIMRQGVGDLPIKKGQIPMK